MDSPSISVIIPVYNVGPYLKQCVDSVLEQDYKFLDVILVDDGSPDECPAMCDEYAKLDNRVRVIHKSNGGLSDARNEGIKAAKGDYIVFLDSDDYYFHTDFLRMVSEATKGGSVDSVFFQRTVFYDKSEKPIETSLPYQLDWNSLNIDSLLLELAKNDRLDASACMKATKRIIFENEDLTFKKGLYSEDVEWFCRYLGCVNSIVLINKPDYYYRKREGSITASLTEKNVKDLFYSIREHSLRIRDSHWPVDRVHAALSYLSYQYYIILGLTNIHLRGSARRQLLNDCMSFKWLASYSISPKTRMSSLIVRVFGVKIASMILGFYIRIK